MASHQPDFLDLLARLARELHQRVLPFMVIGGQAVLVHGEPRLTQDIDLTLGAGPERLPDALAVCSALGLEPLPDDPTAFVRETFVLPAAHPTTGLRVDFIFSTTSYEAQAIERAVSIEIQGVRVPFTTAEDLILHKLFAGRPRDLEDAKGVVHRQGLTLDWDYLDNWVQQFAVVPGRETLPSQLADLRAEK